MNENGASTDREVTSKEQQHVLASAEVTSVKDSGFGEPESPAASAPTAVAAAPATVEPRLTITIPPDKVGVNSGLVNQLGAAANDPAKAPEPEENRRLAGPATGMGTSA
jgi:hypothetical protein